MFLQHQYSQVRLFLLLLVLVVVACGTAGGGTAAVHATPSPVAQGEPIEERPLPTATDTPPDNNPTTPPPALPVAGSEPYYDMGSPTLTDIYISPDGNDGHSGNSRQEPLQTIGAAWSRIPTGTLSGTGYRLNFLPGTYPCEGDCINFFSDRTGTYDFPIVLQAADGPGTVTLLGGLELVRVSYLYLLDLTLWGGVEAGAAFGNNVLHIELGNHVLLRRVTIHGPMDCITDMCNDMQEVLKINQAEYVYVEQSELAGTYQTVLDFFSVQHGHILDNHVHHSGGRCLYLKGGSAYFRIAGNEVDDCREAGIQVGEGSNLPFMQSPWLHYEVYDMKVYNNVVHDVYGSGLGAVGGYNILLAYNTLYRIGLEDESGRPGALALFIHGGRACISADEFGGPAGTQAQCQAHLDAGAWGTAELGEENGGYWIPNRHVWVINNLFYNPAGSNTHYVQFVVNGPADLPAWAVNIPNPSTTDDDLVIRGNIIWNTPIEDNGLFGDNNGSGNVGCQDGNPTCNVAQVQAENVINLFEPELRAPAQGDFRPVEGGNVLGVTAVPIPNFAWDDAPLPPVVPAGDLNNSILRDRNGVLRGLDGPVGAYTAVPPATAWVYLALLVSSQ